MRRIVLLAVLCLISACGGTTTGKQPDAPRMPKAPKGILRVAAFEFRLEDTDPNSNEPFRTILSSNAPIRLQKRVLFTNKDLVNAYVKDNVFLQKTLWVVFSREAAIRLKNITRKNIGTRLAILVDGDIWIAPRIQGEIPDGVAQITGSSVQRYLNRLMDKFRKAADK